MNDKYVVDQDGTKIVKGSFHILPVGNESEEYKQQRELEEQLKLEEELSNQLIPSDKDVLLAEVELNTIELLLELGVI